MKLYVFGTSDDVEVTTGLRMLLKQRPITEIVLPTAEENETHDQIFVTATEHGIQVSSPSDEDGLVQALSKEDIVAFAWDDSEELFELVIDLQDRHIEMWDISDGLSVIDTQAELLEERLSEVLEDFTESLAALVYKMVMDQINGDGKSKYRRPNAD